MFKYVHHVHYVVEDLDATIEYLNKNFGMQPERVEVSKSNHPAKEAIYRAGITEIQVAQPLTADSGLAKHLAQHGPGVFHVAWGIDNIEELHKHVVALGNTMRREGIDWSPRGYSTLNIEPSEMSQGVGYQLIQDLNHRS